MKNQPVVIENTFNAPVSRVWKALTDRNEMRKWYFDLSEFIPETGFQFQFYGGSEEKEYLHLCEVTEVIPERKLTYSWRYQDYEGLSFITFELFPEKSETRLKLTHSGLETFPEIADFARENFAAGWQEIIGASLKKYLGKRD
ncbi:MAG TPA: SRPBCC domain-containing protein [Flavobacteriaceae bacterium]|nr:SRPBCC domain-containing protein [Flavobacteriaceae bacterium]